jgi:AcrR family transcriptional regulator
MKKGETHPSTIRSRKEIAESLLSLMEEGDFNAITISQITDGSRLTRRTFYAHFKDKREVLLYRIDELNRLLLNQAERIDPEKRRELLLCYFRFWMDHAVFLDLLNRNDLLSLVRTSLDGFIRGLRAFYACSREDENKETFYGYTNAALSGLLWGVLKQWIDRGCRETPEELIRQIGTIITVLYDTINQEN